MIMMNLESAAIAAQTQTACNHTTQHRIRRKHHEVLGLWKASIRCFTQLKNIDLASNTAKSTQFYSNAARRCFENQCSLTL